MDRSNRAWAALCLPLAVASASVSADDAAREEMQRKLNEQVMASPFNAGDIKKAEAWAVEAKKKGVVPEQQPPGYWRPGWTCHHMTAYPGYYYRHYRNCVYYHRYYGRYW
jgi:hypothetical protein